MQTKEQERAQFCLEKIKEFGKIDKETASFISGTPATILTNGLGQAMAFWLSKKKEKHDRVFETVKQWLMKNDSKLTAKDDFDFLTKITTLDQKAYIRAQDETLAILQWLKRYARAFQVNDEKEGK